MPPRKVANKAADPASRTAPQKNFFHALPEAVLCSVFLSLHKSTGRFSRKCALNASISAVNSAVCFWRLSRSSVRALLK